jgi:hypothetical protein
MPRVETLPTGADRAGNARNFHLANRGLSRHVPSTPLRGPGATGKARGVRWTGTPDPHRRAAKRSCRGPRRGRPTGAASSLGTGSPKYPGVLGSSRNGRSSGTLPGVQIALRDSGPDGAGSSLLDHRGVARLGRPSGRAPGRDDCSTPPGCRPPAPSGSIGRSPGPARHLVAPRRPLSSFPGRGAPDPRSSLPGSGEEFRKEPGPLRCWRTPCTLLARFAS